LVGFIFFFPLFFSNFFSILCLKIDSKCI
jgi:hypothetical protein